MKPGKQESPDRLSCFLLALAIFLLTLSPILGAAISDQMTEIFGRHQTHKITAAWQGDTDLAGKSQLSLENMRQLAQYHLRGYDLAYAAETFTSALYQEKQSSVRVLGVNESYQHFHHIPLKAGSFLTSGHEKQPVVVIDENLAESLFGNYNVVGLKIELFGSKFTIIGVVDCSLTGRLTTQQTATVYIPAAKMLELNQNSGISYLEVETKDTSTTGYNTALLEQALTAIGQDAAGFQITDYNMQFLLLEQKNLLHNFLTGAVILGLLFGLLRRNIRSGYHFLRLRLQEKYFSEIIKEDRGNLILRTGQVLLIVAAILAVWQLIKFPLYIAPENIPQELIDLSFWADLLKSRFQVYIQSSGYSAFPGEDRLYILQMLQNWHVFLSLCLGWPLFAWGLRQLNMSKEIFLKINLFCCACLVTAMFLGTGIQLVAQMPVATGGRGVLLLFIAVFLSLSLKGEGIISRK